MATLNVIQKIPLGLMLDYDAPPHTRHTHTVSSVVEARELTSTTLVILIRP